jgi:hypothetical protein
MHVPLIEALQEVVKLLQKRMKGIECQDPDRDHNQKGQAGQSNQFAAVERHTVSCVKT